MPGAGAKHEERVTFLAATFGGGISDAKPPTWTFMVRSRSTLASLGSSREGVRRVVGSAECQKNDPHTAFVKCRNLRFKLRMPQPCFLNLLLDGKESG